MATPTASSILNFVKKYPITLCGFSLLFMPSVHRLLVYFTPLLLSTAIFIVAMLSWGPSTSLEKGKIRRGRRNEWAFNGSLKIYEEEDEDEEETEEEGDEVTELSQMKIKERTQVGTVSNGNGTRAEPDPDLGGDGVGMASNGTMYGDQAESHPDLSGESVLGAASNAATSCGQSEPDPDLHGDHVVGTASQNAATAAIADHCEPDPDLHAEQHVELPTADDRDISAATHLHDGHHHLHNHAEPAPINFNQQAAVDDIDYHDAEPDHLDHADYDDAESNRADDYHDAEPDPDLQGEGGAAAAHAKSEEAPHAEKDNHLHAAIAELRQKLGVMKRTPYRDDPREMHSQKLAERLQTLQAAA